MQHTMGLEYPVIHYHLGGHANSSRAGPDIPVWIKILETYRVLVLDTEKERHVKCPY